jgi:hypothetical protein
MPLPLPRLDIRTFDQLVEEGQALLPLEAPSWTDYNAHDPGITLLELFAWLAETGFYRLDRVPAASYRAFLRLAGIESLPARVARAVVVPKLAPPATLAFVPAGTRIASADGGVVFQTTLDTSVSIARIAAVLTGSAADPVDRSEAHLAGESFEILDALYLGFDVGLVNTPAPLSLYFSTGEEEREGTASREHYGASLVWEYHTGADVWAPLANVDDETRALTESGWVRFIVPATASHAPGGIRAPAQANYCFIRARLARGTYDCAPRMRAVYANALLARHAVSEPRRFLDVSRGHAAQTFSLGAAPIVPDTTRLEVIVDGVADAPWSEKATWDRVAPHARAFVVSSERGELTFGDGRIGRVPPTGAQLWATFQIGGGPTGNVPAGTLAQSVGLAGGDFAVTQPLAAIGGAPAESLDDAIGRLLDERARSARAVTARDFEDLVRAMPGVPIARAHALADYHPDMPCISAPGSVTVIVVPRCEVARPTPSAALLHAVTCYLESRRTLTTEVHVVGPCFTVVAVYARLHTSPGVDARALEETANAALNRFLDPLHGGRDGSGWPLGRDVHRAPVMALLQSLPGVIYVDELALQAGDGPKDLCGNVTICPHGLVVPGRHRLSIDTGSVCS